MLRWDTTIAATVLTLFMASVYAVAQPPEDAVPEEFSAARTLDRAFQNAFAVDVAQTLNITTRTRRGSSIVRRMQVIRKQSTGPAKILVRFLEPGDLRGTSMLILERDAIEDDTFVYLPAIRKTRRVPAGERGDAFFGSDFALEDFEARKASDFEIRNLGQDRIHESTCLMVEAQPRDEIGSSYERMIYWVDLKRDLILRIDFYRDGSAFKRLDADPTRLRRFGNRLIPIETRMTTYVTGTETSLQIESYETPEQIPESLFTSQNLGTGNADRDRKKLGGHF